MSFEDVINQIHEEQKNLRLTKEDVWGNNNSNGMIVADSYNKCPIFHDVVPYKSVTIVCNLQDENEVNYWLSYVQGGMPSKRKLLSDNKVALRSDYMCW